MSAGPGPEPGRPLARAHRRSAPSLLTGAAQGSLVAVVSAVVTAFPVVVVAAVVAAITQGAGYSVWLWAMVPVSALADLVLARRLVPLDG